MNVIHFFFFVCMGVLVVCCVPIILFFKLCISCNGQPLFTATVHTYGVPFLLSCLFRYGRR